jgi:hypothetical protein
MSHKPGLYAIKNSNRDFTQKNSWGKNQFNSSFPASLSSYLSHNNLENNYIVLGNDLKVKHSLISTTNLFGISPKSNNIFFAFESIYSPFQSFVIGTLPRVDLVIQDKDGKCLSGIEIKLTALPDNTTCNFSENKFGTEIVIRPDTIVYLACSIAQNFKDRMDDLKTYFPKKFDTIADWSEIKNVLPFIKEMVSVLDNISSSLIDSQKPIVMQPIWKTEGKSPRLTENCLDVFVWSDLGFMQLFLDAGRGKKELTKINRQVRTIVWLFKMLFEFSKSGQFDHHRIIDGLSYNTKNDKAFAVSGMVTHPYMKSKNLIKPRITKKELKNIILGGGQSLLSPERRFDAIIYNSPELF